MDEIYICQGLFDIFNDVTRPLGSEVMELARKKKLDEALQTQATSALEQTNHIMNKFKPLIEEGRPNSFEEVLAKVRWHFTKQEIQALMITLNTVKCSLSLLSSLLSLESSLASLYNSQQRMITTTHFSVRCKTP
jgi:hypothetical protein